MKMYKTIDSSVEENRGAIHSYRNKGAIRIHEISHSIGNIFVVSFNKKRLSSYDLQPIFDYSEYSRNLSADPRYLIFDLKGVEQADEGVVRILIDWYKYNSTNNNRCTAFVNASGNLRKIIESFNLQGVPKSRFNGNRTLENELKRINRDYLKI